MSPSLLRWGVPDRTKATPPPTASTAGVLRPTSSPGTSTSCASRRRRRGPVGGEPLVLAWDLPADRWYASEVLPHPTCTLTVELGSHPRAGMPLDETVAVTGVCTRRFDVDVRGWGSVAGLRFRPGGLAALTGAPASA